LRAVLVAVRGEELRTSAEAVVQGCDVAVRTRPHPAPDPVALPHSLVLHVIRHREPVVLADAMAHNSVCADAYIAARQMRSILILPLIAQGTLIGILHLENDLAPQVFTSGRVKALKVLAAQAAISLENVRLYHE